MNYPILIVKNNFKKKTDFKRGLEWFSKNTPLTITVDEIKTSFKIGFREVSNKTYKGYVPEGIKDQLKTIIPEGKYKCVVFIYGDKAPGIRVSIAEDAPIYMDTDLISLAKISDKGLTLNHEIIHTFFHRLERQGIYLEDPMDTYFNNQSLSAKSSNRTIALETLTPFWGKVHTIHTIPHAVLSRNFSTKKQILGTLTASLNGATFICETLELPYLDNQSNISSIPTGTYEVKYTFSPRFMKFTYEVTNVPGRSGIRIHAGNFFSQINGCILLGKGKVDVNNDGELDMINSKVTITSFEGFMQKKPFTLTII